MTAQSAITSPTVDRPPISGRDRAAFVLPDVSELEHCVTRTRRLPCLLGASDEMSRVLRDFLPSYAVMSESRRGRSLPAVHERGAADPYRAPTIASARPSARVAPGRRSPEPSSAARVGLRLRPGQKGTKQLLAQYGDRLICVRYRYDAQRKKRFKTVELLVAEGHWEPPPPRFPPDQVVDLRVSFADAAIRDRVKRAGGTWNPDRKIWQLRYDRVVALGLTRRIVDDRASNTGCPEPSGGHLHVDARAASR